MIGVLDCNNFFVSCERLFRPDLINKPVIVLSSNDGCVIARSKEVKDMGVPMGVPYFKIKDIVKQAEITTFSTHFALYRDLSRRVFEVMREELGQVEQYSIDEAFFKLEGDFETTAISLKRAVETKLGIPVSIGIASTKTLAKYANRKAKQQTGVFVMDNTEWIGLSSTVKLSELWGVGGALELKYKQHALITAADLMASDQASLAKLFGVMAINLQQELSGNPVYTLDIKTDLKQSLISSRSFQTKTQKIEVLADALAYHVRQVATELRKMCLLTSVIRINIQPSRHGDFVLRGGVKEFKFESPTNDTVEMLRVANALLKQLYEDGVPYKKAGVSVSGFTPEGIEQVSLFNSQETRNTNKKLLATVDYLNSKQSKELVLVGSRLLNDKWQARSETNSPAYTTKWSELAKVKAK